MKRPNETCFQSFATPRKTDSKIEQHHFFGGAGIFFPAKIGLPRGEIHDTRGDLFFFIFPGGKTPCEFFQAEKVVGGGGNRLGGGNSEIYGMACINFSLYTSYVNKSAIQKF